MAKDMRDVSLKSLLSRVSLKIPLSQLAGGIAGSYGLGRVKSMDPMYVGYEELNSLLTTSRGKYVVKIFSKSKDRQTIDSNVAALAGFQEGGIPVPRLYKNSFDSYLYEPDSSPETFLIVMDYFDGKKFTEIPPTTRDVLNITGVLARIHSLSFQTHANYDMWLTVHLPKEFPDKRRYLDPDDLTLIISAVDKMSDIDYSQLSKSIVHFDLHRENIMKNNRGEYCILDLASCDYNHTVFDLGTFIALFCFDPINAPSVSDRIYNNVVEEYLIHRPLSDYELSVLPAIVRATYSSNLLIPTFLQKTNQDESPEQTLYYQMLGRKGLQMLESTQLFYETPINKSS